MTVKLPRLWQRNSDANDGVVMYSDPTVTYSSATTHYSAPAPVADSERVALAWSRPARSKTVWSGNAAATVNRRAFDTHITYNEHVTYDGIVSGEDPEDIKTPTRWSQA
jgi:hypothetical protein